MGKSGKSNKKKKEKIVYVDDGRTIADMSGVRGMGSQAFGNASNGKGKGSRPAGRASYREQLQTYFAAVRMMFLPMLVVLGIIAVAFLIVYILL